MQKGGRGGLKAGSQVRPLQNPPSPPFAKGGSGSAIILDKMDFAFFLIQLLNGLQYGLLLFLVASGLTLIFGIMGIINLAPGSFYMLGAYLAWSLAGLTGSLVAAL